MHEWISLCFLFRSNAMHVVRRRAIQLTVCDMPTCQSVAVVAVVAVVDRCMQAVNDSAGGINA